MITASNVPAPQLFSTPGLEITPPVVQRFHSMYLTSFLLAAVATILLSVGTCFTLITLARNFFANKNMQNKPGMQVPGTPVAANGFTTVLLCPNVVYRLQPQSTYQEVATPDSSLLRQIARQLDTQGIEYEVFKNTDGGVLISKNEWVISWGGIVYQPQATALTDFN